MRVSRRTTSIALRATCVAAFFIIIIIMWSGRALRNRSRHPHVHPHALRHAHDLNHHDVPTIPLTWNHMDAEQRGWARAMILHMLEHMRTHHRSRRETNATGKFVIVHPDHARLIQWIELWWTEVIHASAHTEYTISLRELPHDIAKSTSRISWSAHCACTGPRDHFKYTRLWQDWIVRLYRPSWAEYMDVWAQARNAASSSSDRAGSEL
jgi:hypothetical protein